MFSMLAGRHTVTATQSRSTRQHPINGLMEGLYMQVYVEADLINSSVYLEQPSGNPDFGSELIVLKVDDIHLLVSQLLQAKKDIEMLDIFASQPVKKSPKLCLV